MRGSNMAAILVAAILLAGYVIERDGAIRAKEESHIHFFVLQAQWVDTAAIDELIAILSAHGEDRLSLAQKLSGIESGCTCTSVSVIEPGSLMQVNYRCTGTHSFTIVFRSEGRAVWHFALSSIRYVRPEWCCLAYNRETARVFASRLSSHVDAKALLDASIHSCLTRPDYCPAGEAWDRNWTLGGDRFLTPASMPDDDGGEGTPSRLGDTMTFRSDNRGSKLPTRATYFAFPP